jgi:hypothetical protein
MAFLQNSEGHTNIVGVAQLKKGNIDILHCRPRPETTLAVIRPEVVVFQHWDDVSAKLQRLHLYFLDHLAR